MWVSQKGGGMVWAGSAPYDAALAIRDAAGAIKSVARRAKSMIPIDTPSLGAPWLLGVLATLYERIAGTLKPIMNVGVTEW